MTLPPSPSGPHGPWSPSRTPVERPLQAPIPPLRPGEAPRLYGPPVAPPSGTDFMFGGFWPEKDLTPRPALLGAAAAIGVVAAVILPYHYAVSLAGLIVVAALLLVPLGISRHRASPYTWLVAALGTALVSLMVLRAAGWLTALMLLVLVPLAFSALSAGRTVLDLLTAAVTWPLSLLRATPWARRTAGTVRSLPVGWPVVRTAALCVVALLVFGALFATGDAVFGSWVQALIPTFDGGSVVLRVLVAAAIGALALGTLYTAINPPRPVHAPGIPAGPSRTVRRFEWLAPLGVVIAMFAGFVAAQATTMWAGHDYVQRTAGVTYAESVHKGFGQLTVATLLALLTVAFVWWAAPRESKSDLAALAGALGSLCALALVVVVSALYRMHVYQQAYGFTTLRLVVDAFELWMGLLLLLTIACVALRRVGQLPRAALASAAFVVIGLGWMNPEAWIAEHNVQRFEDTGKVDTAYLATLGPDARAAIARLPLDVAQCSVQQGPRDASWIEWNLGRDRARDVHLDSRLYQQECNPNRDGQTR
ncbi:DUF4153 domain-containing protein [Tsukamurella pseudospumae]|nr:DUF4173 domain-containing protein [Tsukamurella pseudospumae]